MVESVDLHLNLHLPAVNSSHLLCKTRLTIHTPVRQENYMRTCIKCPAENLARGGILEILDALTLDLVPGISGLTNT